MGHSIRSYIGNEAPTRNLGVRAHARARGVESPARQTHLGLVREAAGSSCIETHYPEVEPTVFVLDDDVDDLETLESLIGSVGLKVSTYTSAQPFLDAFGPGHPGCLVLDVRMPGMSGIQLLEELRRRRHSIPAIFLTGHADVQTAIRALKVGAFDFMEKPASEQVLLDRIRDAMERDRELRIVESAQARSAALLARLSPREAEVMRLLVEGMANKEIADVLGLSTRTVEGHRARLTEKLGVTSVANMAHIANLARDATNLE